MKAIKVEYIESGTFQGGEEDASRAKIEYGEEVIVMKKTTYKALQSEIKALKDELKHQKELWAQIAR